MNHKDRAVQNMTFLLTKTKSPAEKEMSCTFTGYGPASSIPGDFYLKGVGMVDDDLCFVGCIELFGAIIRQAVLDYQITHKDEHKLEKEYSRLKNIRKKRNSKDQVQYVFITQKLREYHSAKRFLFGKYGLESWAKRCGLEDFIEIDYLRKKALESFELTPEEVLV